MNKYFIVSFFSVLFFLDLCAGGEGKKINSLMEEMLEYHVEHKAFSALLAKRSLKLFIDQFDVYKIYLLQSEIGRFSHLSESRLKEVVRDQQKGKYTVYEELSHLIQEAIYRARDVRTSLRQQLLSQDLASLEGKEEEFSESFPQTQVELKEKIHKQLLSFLLSEKKLEGRRDLSLEQKEKILDLWEKRLRRSEEPYLKEGEKSLLSMHILKAFSKSLDAHSSFFSVEEAQDLKTTLEKQFEGIGVVLREGVRGVVIKSLVKNGPAERSGKIQEGDLLVAVDGESAGKLSYEEVLGRLKGGKGQKISLVFSRFQEDQEVEFSVELFREKIVMEEDRVRHQVIPCGQGVIGVVEIPSFYESGDGSSCEKDLKEAIRQLRWEGNLQGLILDMRENSGGFLSQAVKVSSLFVSSGVIVISKYAYGQMQYLRNTDGKIFYQGPLVILTSKASASATEIVAQALQDYGIAVVVGDERTYGKGSIQYQTVTEEGASSYFKVTVGKYYTVSGRSTQIEGVKADLIVPTSYAPFNIGEKYLLYPLKNDQVEDAFTDPLLDVAPHSRAWMQKNYLPNLQKKFSFWTEVMPILRANSQYRIQHNKDFLSFLKIVDGMISNNGGGEMPSENFGQADLQMTEAVHVVKDMKFLQECRKKR